MDHLAYFVSETKRKSPKSKVIGSKGGHFGPSFWCYLGDPRDGPDGVYH